MWNNQPVNAPAAIELGLDPAEALPEVFYQPWQYWLSLNRLLTGIGRAKPTMRRRGYIDNTQYVTCGCGEPQTMAHLIYSRLLDESCSLEDLITVKERTKACAKKWQYIKYCVKGTREEAEMWCYRRMLRIRCMEKKTNKSILDELQTSR